MAPQRAFHFPPKTFDFSRAFSSHGEATAPSFSVSLGRWNTSVPGTGVGHTTMGHCVKIWGLHQSFPPVSSGQEWRQEPDPKAES